MAGAWLNALPISSLGLRMDDNTVRVAVGLRLGTSLCRPHSCAHCRAEVDCKATHGLSCRRSVGRHYWHAALNDIVHRAMTSAHIPSRLEPSGIFRFDGKCPDGITVVPWENGKLLVWDATCPDTFTPSYTTRATSEPGAVAAGQVHPPGSFSLLHPCSCRDLGGHWSPVASLSEGTWPPPEAGYGGRPSLFLPPPESGCGSAEGECGLGDGYNRFDGLLF